jgi:hypothetical protein
VGHAERNQSLLERKNGWCALKLVLAAAFVAVSAFSFRAAAASTGDDARSVKLGRAIALQDAVNGVIPGPPTFYQWILPLDYDGSGFTVPTAYACGTSWDARPYFAAKDGPLTLNGPVSLKPACGASANPNNVPSSADRPAFYVVALPLSWTHGKPGGRHFDANSSMPAIAVAGPVDPGARAWIFAPLQPGLKMRASYGYVFFVAELMAL